MNHKDVKINWSSQHKIIKIRLFWFPAESEPMDFFFLKQIL